MQQEQAVQQEQGEEQRVGTRDDNDSQDPTAAIQAEFWQRWMSLIYANTEQAFDKARVTLQ